MKFNPFEMKPMKLEKCFEDWKKLAPKPYDKNEVDPYTRVRCILMNGTEFEMNWFMHQFARHTPDNDLRRDLALIRRSEQQQQKKIAALKPIDESILETTIGYEQLAVDLTATMARREPDAYVRNTLDFALLEDFDHLYRYSDLLEMEQGVRGEHLVGGYTEIMPGRPTISHHRHPYDDVRRSITNKTADPLTVLQTAIITAAEQQTMNYYMNLGSFYQSQPGRELYTEIAMIEEQHVTQYESLMDPTVTWFECLLHHEYTECYLYYSMMNDETDENIRKIWESHLEMEIAHLHMAASLLKKYEKKEWQQVIPQGAFPETLKFNSEAAGNREYIRNVLKGTVHNSALLEDYVPVTELPENYEFFRYNDTVNKTPENVASHTVIESFIGEFGEDYRFEKAEHPIKALRNRHVDNVEIGRVR